MTDYEKQLEEANQRLLEQLEKEIERADKLERKLKANEWRNLEDPGAPKYTPNKVKWEEWNKKRHKDAVVDEILSVQPMPEIAHLREKWVKCSIDASDKK